MKAFLGGTLVGIAISGFAAWVMVPSHLLWETYDHLSNNPAPYRQQSGIVARYSTMLGQDWTWKGETPLHRRELRMVDHHTIRIFKPGDIERVCLSPVYHHPRGHVVQINADVLLTPEARAAVAEDLKALAGRHLSFQYRGETVTTFIPSEEKRAAFATGEAQKQRGFDFQFTIPIEATLVGVILAHELARPGAPEPCSKGTGMKDIPFYEHFTELYEKAVEAEQNHGNY